MEELAPPSIAFAARLRAARDHDRRRHGPVVRAVACRHVGVAPVDIEDLGERVGVGFATGAVQPRKDGGVGVELRHGDLWREGVPGAGLIARVRK